MKIKIVAVGKVKEKLYQQRIDEYLKWVKKYNQVELIELKNSKPKEIEKKQLSYMSNTYFSVCLSEEGSLFTSREFSDFCFQQHQDILFLIGGPDGHSKTIRKKARLVLSLSKMTLPHEMALMVLSEQLYRAVSIKNGSKYHRD